MQASSPAAITTWCQDEAEEDGMFVNHSYLWCHMIGAVSESDFSRYQVLDYGCNRGGFLQTLFRKRPFRRGIGVDVAHHSLAVARQRNAALPIEFITPDHLERYADSVDIAFSHEVIYLLSDLDAHAAAIARSLKNGAAYYAAIGCHTGNPQWSRWRQLIAQSTNLPVFDYSLDDYARAFWNAGMRVEMRPFGLQDFVLIKQNNAYFPSVADSLHYHTNVKTLICARKAG
jgi:SAM-dependent methyltransferase